LKGERVRAQFKGSGGKFGKVIAENTDCVAVEWEDNPEVPMIVRKTHVSVVYI